MSATAIAEVRVSHAAEGRKVEISLQPALAELLAGGGSAQLSFDNSEVDFKDPLTESNAVLDGEPVGVVEVTLTVAPADPSMTLDG